MSQYTYNIDHIVRSYSKEDLDCMYVHSHVAQLQLAKMLDELDRTDGTMFQFIQQINTLLDEFANAAYEAKWQQFENELDIELPLLRRVS